MALWRDLAAGYLGYLYVPWAYLALAIFVLVQYRRVQAVERSAFGVKVTRAVRDWGISLLIGLGAGLCTTAALSLLDAHIVFADVICLWVIAIVLSLFTIRFTCVSYGAGLLVLAQGIALLVVSQGGRLGYFTFLLSLHASSLLLLAAVLHVVEGALIYLTGFLNASPLFVQSRRGQIVGAFLLQKLWLVPTVLSVTPGFAIPFPVLIGYSGLATSSVPRQMTRSAGFLTAVYGVCMVGLAILAMHFGHYYTIVALLLIGLHEGLYHWVKSQEEEAPPLFVRPFRGVRVLACIPGSPADKMKLVPGETITKVSGISVNSPYDVHFAIDQNPAYVKIEVADDKGEIRFVGTPLYESDPHQLGVILVPDERAREYAQIYRLSVGSWLGRWLGSKKRFFAEHSTNV